MLPFTVNQDRPIELVECIVVRGFHTVEMWTCRLSYLLYC